MPGNKTTGPSTIERSDKKAQAIFKKAHDSAIKTYGEGAAAHRVAYAALKHQYEKQGDRWVAKGWKGPSDPQAAQGYKDKPKATANGRVARTEKEAVAKGKEDKRAYSRAYRARTKKAGPAKRKSAARRG